MRVRSHVKFTRNAGGKFERAEMIEEDEWTNHSAGMKREHPPDLKPAAEIMDAFADDTLDAHFPAPSFCVAALS